VDGDLFYLPDERHSIFCMPSRIDLQAVPRTVSLEHIFGFISLVSVEALGKDRSFSRKCQTGERSGGNFMLSHPGLQL